MNQLSANLQSYLDFYAQEGYHLIPLRGKIPQVKDFPNTPFETFPKSENFPENFGIALQADDLVIDIDPRNFPAGRDCFREISNLYPEILGKTLTIRTGGGGMHLYFKKPADFAIRGGLKEYPGVEFKTRGQQVVGAGSTHPDTNLPYEFLVKHSPINISTKFLLMIEKKLANMEGSADVYTDDDQSKQRYIDYLLSTEPAIEGEGGDHRTFQVIARGRDFGLSANTCTELFLKQFNPRCRPAWTLDEINKKVKNVYLYATNSVGCLAPEVAFKDVEGISAEALGWDHDAQFRRTKSLRNTVNFFLMKGSPLLNILAFNQFSYQIIFTRIPPWRTEVKPYTWTDEEALCCKNWMANELVFEPNTNTLHECAVAVSQNKQFHPVRQYLEAQKWDGVKRLHIWLHKYMNAVDTEYTRAVGVKMMVAAVKRVYEPGCKFDYIPVFEGKQGTGKSQAFRVLANPWFSDQVLDIHSKDTIHSMFGKWIIEISEMESHKRTDTQAMKAFLSRDTDTARLAYMRIAKDYPRQSIFIGTINPEDDEEVGWLKDTTGNRRYWPVCVENIDLVALQQIRHQLWAEAAVLYREGVLVYFEDRHIERLAEEEQKKRLGRDPWTNRIALWLENDPIWGKRDMITTENVFVDCIGGKIMAMSRREQVRISSVMLELGWKKGVFYSAAARDNVRGYKRPEIE